MGSHRTEENPSEAKKLRAKTVVGQAFTSVFRGQ